MQKLARMLFPDELKRDEFVKAVMAGNSREKAIVILEDRPEIRTFPRIGRTSWQPEFVERLAESFRPAQHPLYQRGSYYSLDNSSVFAASAMLAVPTPPRFVLDLCASPGGKAIFCWRAFQPEVLYCNETIRKRTRPLIENLNRCKVTSGRVWTADPSVYGRRFVNVFDLVIVDAPCSGQSLLAKGDKAPGCFFPTMIDMNHSRQRRITGHAAHAMKPGGYLLYMTCTYAYKENEKIIEWLLGEYQDLETVPVPHLSEYQSEYTEEHCYRLFPQSGLGAGAFTCLIRKKGEAVASEFDFSEAPTLWKFGEPVPFAPVEPKDPMLDNEPTKPNVNKGVRKPAQRRSAPRPQSSKRDGGNGRRGRGRSR
jgi:16S rRNA C967 or C1407 C5-methylase (RsmB/RsmF family)